MPTGDTSASRASSGGSASSASSNISFSSSSSSISDTSTINTPVGDISLSSFNSPSPISRSSRILHDIHSLSTNLPFSSPIAKPPLFFACSLSGCSNNNVVFSKPSLVSSHFKLCHSTYTEVELNLYSLSLSGRMQFCKSCSTFYSLNPVSNTIRQHSCKPSNPNPVAVSSYIPPSPAFTTPLFSNSRSPPTTPSLFSPPLPCSRPPSLPSSSASTPPILFSNSTQLPTPIPFPLFPLTSPPTQPPQPTQQPNRQPTQSAQEQPQHQQQYAPLPSSFLSLDQAVCSKQTWLDLPYEMRHSFTSFCKKVLLAYKLASVGSDFSQMTRILSHFLCIPQLILVRNRGGRKALSQLKSKIDHAAAKYSEQEAFSSAILNSIQQRVLAANVSNPDLIQDPQERETLRRIANARKYMKMGCLGRAAKALLKRPLAPIDSNTIQQLQQLHPLPLQPHDLPPPPPHSPPNQVDKVKLGKIIRTRLANGSAPGPSGWTGELLSVLSHSEDCLDGLMHIIQDMTNNRLEPHARDLLTQSRLFAIPKSASDDTPRPLAIAEPLLKLANLYQLDGLQESLFDHFRPLQEAVCSPSGCEKAIHVLNAALEARTLAGPNLPAVLLADASNAFQSVPRTEVLSRLFEIQELSALHGIASFTYGSPSSLVVQHTDGHLVRIQSAEGVKQGCNLGTILYSIAMHPTFVQSIEGLDVSAKAYADDFSAVGTPEVLLEVINRLSNSIYGLNLSKTKLLWPHSVDPPADLLEPFTRLGIQIVRTGARLLGGFITVPGGEQLRAATEHLRSVVASHEPMISALSHPSMRKQDSLLLLRYCTVPTLSFHARITPPIVAAAPFHEFDSEITRCVFEKLLFFEGESLQTLHTNIAHFHTPSFDSVRSQISLPLRLGGLGIRLSPCRTPKPIGLQWLHQLLKWTPASWTRSSSRVLGFRLIELKRIDSF